jgi:plasmid maintenance system antidote protein VapI
MSLNFALYSGYEKRKITRKVLADKLGVTAFRSSEIVHKRRILDRVMKAIAEKIGRAIGNRSPRTISAHRNGRP